MHSNSPQPDRDLRARLTFGFALLIFIHRWITHTLLHQMQQPVVFTTEFDYTYWLYQSSGFPELVVHSKTGAFIFDALLLLSTLYCFFTAARRWPAVLTCAICWTCYGLTYNTYSCHHNATMTGIMVLPYAFLVGKKKSFRLVWDGFRYFTLYIYADAFLNKIFLHQGLFHFLNGVEFIKINENQFMLQHPGSPLTGFYTFFLVHPSLAYTGFFAMVLLQGSMWLGFFTKKWDRYLFFVPIIFHSINYLFIDVLFYELLILNITLWPFDPRRRSTAIARQSTMNAAAAQTAT